MNKFFNETKIINSAKNSKKPHSLFIEILIFILLFFIVSIPQGIISGFVQIYYMFTDESIKEILSNSSTSFDISELSSITAEIMNKMPATNMLVMLFTTAFVIIGTIFYCTKIEKRSLYSMGFSKKGISFEYLSGMLIGFAMFSLAVLICLLTKTMTIDQLNPQIPIGMIILFFVGYLVQGASEEVICRGYFMISLTRNKAFVTAILANSLIFSALHLANPGVSFLGLLNIVLFGIFASCYILKRGSLWGACAIHSIWNFTQGNFYGINVSGTSAGDSIFTSSVTESGKLINGGDFGLEGGLAVTVVLVLSIVVVLLTKTKKTELFTEKRENIDMHQTTVL